MRIISKREEWVKCRKCSGTGGVNPVPVNLVSSISLRPADRAKLLQGVCLACGGLGQRKVVHKEVLDQVGFFKWVWIVLFGRTV